MNDYAATARKITELRTSARNGNRKTALTLKQWRRIVRKQYGL